ncbi:MAG: hypothetical protein JKY50_00175 [Oleispira sp.]|nr:hypothetical protein [Oleispira sp.]
MTRDEMKVLRHIVNNGDDRNIKAKAFRKLKSSLYVLGYIERRVSDWAWVPTTEGTGKINE